MDSVLCTKRGMLVVLLGLLFVYTLSSLVTSSSFAGISEFLDKSRREGRQENQDDEYTTVKNVLPVAKHDQHLIVKQESSANIVRLDMEEEFKRRRELYEEMCTPGKKGRVSKLFIHPQSKLSVCLVPKAGCTFWKSVFKYLYNYYDDEEVNSPLDISRPFVHSGGFQTFPMFSYKTTNGRIMADASNKVLIARDPYTRLWSAFVDKFILPDSWLDHGLSMMDFRENASDRKPCPDDIQFEEFLSYTFHNNDDHWKPISDICDPCTYRPQYVGHMETFGRDVKYILESRSLGRLLENHDHSKHVQDEIRLLIDYHFQRYQKRRLLHSCLTSVQLASRLWKAFQINGYLKMNAQFPEAKIEKAIKGLNIPRTNEVVIEMFLERFSFNPIAQEEWKLQRAKNMIEAYRKIPESLKNKTAQRFEMDFKLFGYDPLPPDERKIDQS